MLYRRLLSALAFAGAAASSFAQQVEVTLDVFIAAPTVTIYGAFHPDNSTPSYFAELAGDGRTFGEAGTSRFTQTVTIDTTTWQVTAQPANVHSSTTTFNYGPAGTESVTRTVSPNLIQASGDYDPITQTVTIIFNGNPNNPTIKWSPGITYFFNVNYNTVTRTWSVPYYETDRFPSYHLKTTNGDLLKKTETTPWALMPAIPNQSGSVTFDGYPLLSPNENFSDRSAYESVYITNTILTPPGQVPTVRLGELMVHDYKDPATNTWYRWE